VPEFEKVLQGRATIDIKGFCLSEQKVYDDAIFLQSKEKGEQFISKPFALFLLP